MSKSGIGPLIFLAAACALFALPALADSQARIVRLSDVRGSVQIDKNSGRGFENAFLNLPITQGTQIRTRDGGRAEVEFEDGSTLHLGPDSLVQFNTLGLSDAGARISVVNLAAGLAYLNWLGKKGDQFTLNFSNQKVAIDKPAHFRAEVTASRAQFAVFSGEVDVEGPSGKVTVSKKKIATFDADDDKPTLASIDHNALDDWDKQADDYHTQYASNNSSPYGYGASDLGYYGSYQNIPGYGMLWQPYFAGVAWDPFMDGAWSFYPGMGYMFVSAYPWGWMPFLYGNWLFIPSAGWMWQPGAWSSFGTVPRFTGTLPAHFTAPVAPTGTASVVVFGKGGPVTSTTSPAWLTLRNGSAGLGIARGSLDNLHGLSHQVAKSGFAEVHPAPAFAASSSHSAFGGWGDSSSPAGRPGPEPAAHTSVPVAPAPPVHH